MSHRFWSPDAGEPREPFVPRDPFAWGPKKNERSLFEVTFLLDDVRYQYGFQASDEQFLEEWLYAWPSGKKQVWFERESQTFKFGENLKGENKVIEKVTRPNALFLSAAVQHKHPQLLPIFSWFRSFEVVNVRGGRYPAFSNSNGVWIRNWLDCWKRTQANRALFQVEELPKPLLEDFRNLLKQADIGIVDVRVEKNRVG